MKRQTRLVDAALRVLPGAPERRLAEAMAFLEQAYAEQSWSGLDMRRARVADDIRRTGAYDLTPEELAFGCRVAWRNSNRCVGRSYWPSLQVRDLRHVTDAGRVFEALVEHLLTAWNEGDIRPVISVFGPGVRVLNDQLIRYAAYERADGRVIGDPRNVDLTRRLMQLGWRGGAGTPFDVLPLAVRSGERVHLFEWPPEAVHEVPLRHPDLPWFEELGLRWHALPVISDLRLEIGGLDFTCAPFNGWYLQTEIAARNLADPDRYDILPVVARRMGLDTRRERTLWRDRALLEVNVAVLHSFDAAGVKIGDHHAVTRHFVNFEARERRAGRRVTGRWSWLVPPVSPATTPVYHRSYEDVDVRPNFYPQRAPWPSGDGRSSESRCPFHRVQ